MLSLRHDTDHRGRALAPRRFGERRPRLSHRPPPERGRERSPRAGVAPQGRLRLYRARRARGRDGLRDLARVQRERPAAAAAREGLAHRDAVRAAGDERADWRGPDDRPAPADPPPAPPPPQPPPHPPAPPPPEARPPPQTRPPPQP